MKLGGTRKDEKENEEGEGDKGEIDGEATSRSTNGESGFNGVDSTASSLPASLTLVPGVGVGTLGLGMGFLEGDAEQSEADDDDDNSLFS
jgi:hypothetical protein